jgi:hypothetical protein
MGDRTTGRVDPRALMASIRRSDAAPAATQAVRGAKRAAAVGLAAIMGLAAFGTLVVRANDDQGAIAFIQSQVKPRQAARGYAPAAPQRAAYPVSYYAPRAFFPGAPQRAQPASAPTGRNTAIVASYAPFSGFFPSEPADPMRGTSPARVRTPSVAKPATPLPAIASAKGGRVTYCVRTCDGYFFPLSNSTGSDKGDELACNSLCPTSETKVYIGQIGTDIDEARARQTGRRYAQMRDAFTYRTSLSASCTCSVSGVGLTNAASVARDGTLRAGDVIMTPKGMRVFVGGQMPYREANFTTIDRSRQIAVGSREALRRLEQASLPGKSGVSARNGQRRGADEVADLRRATQALQQGTQVVRYVGPDRNAVSR